MSKFCRKCGAQLDDNAAFCGNCGTSQTAPVQQIQPQTQQSYAQHAEPQMKDVFGGSSFDGGVLDTFVNSLVASLIISITCGIATPWAVAYMWNFIISHITIDGKRLTFDGNGTDLFGQWIIWFLLSCVTCGIYSFWVIPKMYNWVASHTHFAK